MHKLTREVADKFVTEMLEEMDKLEEIKKMDFVAICVGFGWTEPADHAREHGIPRYIVAAPNVVRYYQLLFESYCPVLNFSLFEDNSIMFSWGKSETDNVLQLKTSYESQDKI